MVNNRCMEWASTNGFRQTQKRIIDTDVFSIFFKKRNSTCLNSYFKKKKSPAYTRTPALASLLAYLYSRRTRRKRKCQVGFSCSRKARKSSMRGCYCVVYLILCVCMSGIIMMRGWVTCVCVCACLMSIHQRSTRPVIHGSIFFFLPAHASRAGTVGARSLGRRARGGRGPPRGA